MNLTEPRPLCLVIFHIVAGPFPFSNHYMMMLSNNEPSDVDLPYSILLLPTELLIDILSFLLPPICGQLSQPPNPPLEAVPPYQTVRHVCKTFRTIADQLPFWYEREFQFEILRFRRIPPLIAGFGFSYFSQRFSLYSYEPYHSSKTASFVDVLLQDAHLVECLGRKKAWAFYSKEVFGAISRNIPGVHNNTEWLHLDWRDGVTPRWSPGSSAGIKGRLTCFTNLGYLQLQTDSDYAGFSSYALPNSLRILRVDEPWRCNVHELDNLQDFSARIFSLPRGRINLRYIIPMLSASKLTSLTLDFSCTINEMRFDALDAFTSLDTLIIRLPPLPFIAYLPRSRLSVSKFLLTLQSVDECRELTATLSAPFFRSVKHFAFEVKEGQIEPQITFPLIAAFTRLSELEEIELSLPIQIEWCRLVRNFTSSVRRIRWEIANLQDPPEPTEVQDALLRAFEHRDRTPVVDVSLKYEIRGSTT